MAIVGTQYKIHYVARDFTSGLSDVQLFIKKPDNTTEGYYIMTESQAGVYSYTVTLNQTGQWLFICDSPSCPNKYAQSLDVTSLEIISNTSQIPVADFN